MLNRELTYVPRYLCSPVPMFPEPVKEELKAVKEELRAAKTNMQINRFEIDRLEQYSLRDSVRVCGIAETDNENTNDIVVRVAIVQKETSEGSRSVPKCLRAGRPNESAQQARVRAEESQPCEQGVDGERPDRMPH